MIREAQVFLLAVQFLTRLPVPRDLPFSERRQAEAAKYYPLVGLLIGALGAIVLWLTGQLFPMVIAVLLATAATIAATGALHEDGLADAADGVGGGLTRDKALEIMRDSRIGSYGILAVGLTLALKVAALSAMPLWIAVTTLCLAHVISRYAPVLVIFTAEYARAQGTKFAVPTISATGHYIALACAALAALILFALIGPAAFLGLGCSVFLALIVTRLYLRKLGGFTGDCLGATQQMAELGLYLGVLAWL